MTFKDPIDHRNFALILHSGKTSAWMILKMLPCIENPGDAKHIINILIQLTNVKTMKCISNKAKCLSNINECQAGLYFGNEIQCQNHSMFHCRRSNQCIWQDWVCDGFVQCLQGEDEDFDLCYSRGSFAEGATVKCNETKRYGYNVTILASKCNDIVECRDGIDEVNCQNNDSEGLIALGIVFIAVAVIWVVVHVRFANDDTSQEASYDPASLHFKGDKLSHIKVYFS